MFGQIYTREAAVEVLRDYSHTYWYVTEHVSGVRPQQFFGKVTTFRSPTKDFCVIRLVTTDGQDKRWLSHNVVSAYVCNGRRHVVIENLPIS